MFDIFGTVFSLKDIPREEIKAYVDHIRQPEWSPLVLPGHWTMLPAHSGAANAIFALRSLAFVVTCSNAPLKVQAFLSQRNDVRWAAMVPLEIWRVYKPNLRAYQSVIDCFDVAPADAMMVTANETFGDLEAAKALGIQPCLICDDPENEREGVLCVKSIMELYTTLAKE